MDARKPGRSQGQCATIGAVTWPVDVAGTAIATIFFRREKVTGMFGTAARVKMVMHVIHIRQRAAMLSESDRGIQIGDK